MSAHRPADALQRVRIGLNKVLDEFKIPHEAYHSQINIEREWQESETYYNLLMELGLELEREISA